MLFSNISLFLSLATLSLSEVVGTHTVVSVYTPVVYKYVTVYDDDVSAVNKDVSATSSAPQPTVTSYSSSSLAISTSQSSGTTIVQPTTSSSSTEAASTTASTSTTPSSTAAATSTTSSAAAQATSSTSYSGDATFYEVGAATGACGQMHSDSEYVIAIGKGLYDSEKSSSNVSEYCGKKINAHYQGKTVQVTVVDRCEGCSDTSLDFSPTAFQQLAPESAGRISITWEWA